MTAGDGARGPQSSLLGAGRLTPRNQGGGEESREEGGTRKVGGIREVWGNPGRWASTQAGGPEAALSRQDPVIEPLPVSKPRDGNGLLCFVDYFLHLIRMLIWFNGCIKAVNLWDLCLIHTVSISEVSTGVWQ